MRSLFANCQPDILEVACGTGWMSERLSPFGHVTAVDLADEVISRARIRVPYVDFVAGDFMDTDLGESRFDVVVGLEAMSHFSDQAAFLRRIFELLRQGGYLMLATQNRPIMERNIQFLPNAGWYRHWVDRQELHGLLEPQFVIHQLRSITPTFFSGPLHFLNSQKLEGMLDKLKLGAPLRRIKRFEEDHDMGWTLMCLSQKR